jgi:hypothetical protein
MQRRGLFTRQSCCTSGLRYDLCIVPDLCTITAREPMYWRVGQHRRAPVQIRNAVVTLMSIRLVEHGSTSILSLVPNEVLFIIFALLPWY